MKKNRVVILLMACVLLTACTPINIISNKVRTEFHKKPSMTAQGVRVGAASGAAEGGLVGGAPGALVGAAIGGITGGAVANHFDIPRNSLVAYLRKNNVQVIQMGDEIMVVLPSDQFFYPRSPNLNAAETPVLQKLAIFLRRYTKVTVKVAGYTDNQGSAQANLVLSRQQAQNLADFIWPMGTNTRLMYSIGYGDNYPISNNITPLGRYQNRRIQITLRELPILT